MNCKPGDLAVVIKADNPQNIGRIGVVLRQWRAVGTWVLRFEGRPAATLGGPNWEPWAYDHELRPFRDNDGQDEMLRIAGKPREKVEG